MVGSQYLLKRLLRLNRLTGCVLGPFGHRDGDLI